MTLLVFTGTAGYRHDSIAAGVATLRELGYDIEHTEDPAVFDSTLDGFAALVFLNTSGDIVGTGERKAAIESYVGDGGPFVGIHCAAATEDDWPFYRRLIGARFLGHPDIQPGRVLVADADHPATAPLPAVWDWVDEWYNFDVRPDARLLLTADESSYEGGSMGDQHPLAWCRDGFFYTALGHSIEAYTDALFRAHLRGGIDWSLSNG